jgi:hypothetical protein
MLCMVRPAAPCGSTRLRNNPGDRGDTKAEERPVPVGLDTTHELVRDPQPVEQDPGTLFLLPVVLLQVEKVKDVGRPRLEVHCKRPLPLSAHPGQHPNNPIGRPVGPRVYDWHAGSTRRSHATPGGRARPSWG